MLGEATEAFRGLFSEIYSANEEKLYRLVLMGLRSLLEQIMIAKVGDQGTFQANLEKLKGEGYISLLQFDQLSTVLDAGHAVIHRGFDPEELEVQRAFDVVERILGSIFMHDEDVSMLSARIPPRPARHRPAKN